MKCTRVDWGERSLFRILRSVVSVFVWVSIFVSLAENGALAESTYETRGLIVAPGESIQIYLKDNVEGDVPSLASYLDVSGGYGSATIQQAQIEAQAGRIDVDHGQVDSFIYTAPTSEGLDQIIVADLYGRTADPSREMAINIFIVNESDPSNSIFGKLGLYPSQIRVEEINPAIVYIPSVGAISGYALETPFTFDRLQAYTLATDGAARNLVIRNFMLSLAGSSDRHTYQAQKDCSRMLPGETLDAYIKRCLSGRTGPKPPVRGQKEVDTTEPQPIKGSVGTGPIPVSTGSTGGHLEGTGTVGWTPPSPIGGVGGGVTVGGGRNWNNTCTGTAYYDRQEKSWTRTTRQWDGRKWVIIKTELCTQTFISVLILCPPNDPVRQGPLPMGEPYCRVVK